MNSIPGDSKKVLADQAALSGEGSLPVVARSTPPATDEVREHLRAIGRKGGHGGKGKDSTHIKLQKALKVRWTQWRKARGRS